MKGSKRSQQDTVHDIVCAPNLWHVVHGEYDSSHGLCYDVLSYQMKSWIMHKSWNAKPTYCNLFNLYLFIMTWNHCILKLCEISWYEYEIIYVCMYIYINNAMPCYGIPELNGLDAIQNLRFSKLLQCVKHSEPARWRALSSLRS